MSRRLNQEREKRLQPKRMQIALSKIGELYPTKQVSEDKLEFVYEGNTIFYWPYSGWASGKGIKDGRGLSNLLKQINPVIVDFMQLPLEGVEPDEFIDWADKVGLIYQCERNESISISNTGADDTWIHVAPGDYVLLDENGKFYSMKNPGDLLPQQIDD